MAKVYYNTDQIIPSPEIALGTRIDYASETNNIIVGHNHTITLTGVATAYLPPEFPNPRDAILLQNVVDSISSLRSMFSKMGGTLYIKDDNSTDLIVATGAKLISFDVTESDNNWKAFANYTIQLEFQSIDYLAEAPSCLVSILSSSTTTNAVDNSKYKLKEYSENFNVEIGEDIYNRIRMIDSGQDADIENMYFNFTYTISATGKNFFVDGQLLPAWEQAKNFCQNKLYFKVKFLATVLGLTSPDGGCGPTRTLQNIHHQSFTDALIVDLSPEYSIFNEQVSVSTSESDGSFSATYKCIVKRLTGNKAIHTFSKNIRYSKAENINTTITINGTIQGLIEGGLIFNTNGFFTLPQNGNLIATGNGLLNDKYENALLELNSYIIQDDFTDTFKDQLNITYSGLYLDQSFYDCTIPTTRPKPSSFNLTHNPFEGTITYTGEFSSDKNCQSEFNNVTINVNKPTPIYATFIIPGAEGTSNIGTVLQNLGTRTAQTIDISIQGRSDSDKRCCYNSGNINNILSGLCGDIVIPSSIADKLPDPADFILKTKNKTTNFMDGSYTINLGYICNEGCDI